MVTERELGQADDSIYFAEHHPKACRETAERGPISKILEISGFDGNFRKLHFRAWRSIRLMDRHIFFSSKDVDARTMAAVKKTVQGLGAKVVNTAPGGLLIEATPEVINQVASALPGWHHTMERKTMGIPERTPLERAKLAARRRQN